MQESAHILVVDDHEDTAHAMERLLTKLGYQVRVAHCYADALQEFDREGRRIDLLISDIRLPDGSGLDLMQELKKRNTDGLIRGITLSGMVSEEDVKQSKAAGFTEHVAKPFSFKNLEEVIARVLKRDV